MKTKTAKAHCDKLFSRLIRRVGHCEMCGTTQNLQCAHWISRRFSWTRTYEPNAFCLCAACHRAGHDNPTRFSDWAIEKRGRETYEKIRERSQRRDKFDWHAELERLRSL